MSVIVKNDFISAEDISGLTNTLYPQIKETPRPGVFSTLGWQNALMASKVGFEMNSQVDNNDGLVTKTLKSILVEMGNHFEVEDLVLVNAFYTVMKPGSQVGLHCDNCNLDGSPLDPDVEIEPNEWSAVLYLNNAESDFTGGHLVFPKHDLDYSPKAGDLVYFKTDVDHAHEVTEVTGGERVCLVIFTGRRSIVEQVSADFSNR